MTQSVLDQSCSYWRLSEDEREAVNASAPDQDQWQFEIYRLASGYWAFDMPELKTHQELLVGGTEVALDALYSSMSECMPKFSRMTMTVSRVPLDDDVLVHSCTLIS